jgi:hypothetical protein
LDFAILIAAYMLAATALGLLLGTCFKSSEKANATGVITASGWLHWWCCGRRDRPRRYAHRRALPADRTMMDAIGK